MNTLSHWTRRIVLLATLAAAVSPALRAQTELSQARITVPFAFDYASRHFAPGVYTVDLYWQHFLTIRALDGSKSATSMLQNEITAHAPLHGKVIFLRSGSSYRLQEVWTAGNLEYFHIIRTKAKKHSELASNGAPPVTVEIALLERPAPSKH